MSVKRRSQRVLSLIVTIVILLGLSTPFAYTEGNQLFLTKYDLEKETESKIDHKIRQELEKADLVEIMVYMKEQVDSVSLARATENSMDKLITPHKGKLQIKTAVIDALKDKAEMTQLNILKYLEQEKDKGNVEEYKAYHIVNMIYVKANRKVVEDISNMREVERIYRNEIHSLDLNEIGSQDTALSSSQPEWNIKRVGADAVWDLGYDGSGIVVGILDSGVDGSHPALKNQWRGYNPNTGVINSTKSWYDPIYNSNFPVDSSSHGTHVLGTMVGMEENGNNPIGVAPGAKWIGSRVFDNNGKTTDDILLSAAEWMLAPGGDPSAAPDVINNSWGGGEGINDWYLGAVQAWRAAGIFPVFAAGNQQAGEPAPWPGSISIPSNYIESFAVGATDINDIRGSFSKLGPSPYDPKAIKPNISAPGVNIYSSIPGGGYSASFSGTSMAAPHVAGSVALLLSANASLTVDQIEEILSSTADALVDNSYPQSPNFGYGHGMVNAFEAVSQVATGTGYITGHVMIPGNDMEEPVIIHEQKIFESFIGTEINIESRVTDDIAIKEVELLVQPEGKNYWMVASMNRISGNHKDGLYRGTITTDMLIGKKLSYKIRVTDFAEDTILSQSYHVTIKEGIVPNEYAEGFESEPMGWLLNGSWEWGKSTEKDPKPVEGDNLVATKIGGNYPNGADDWLVTPPIDLSGGNLKSASLRFYEWFEIEKQFDNGHILITDDYGENWLKLGDVRTGTSDGWRETAINLGEYIGSTEPIYIGFYLQSDNMGQELGWYIDNVRLVGNEEIAPAAPTEVGVETGFTSIKLNWLPSGDADVNHYNIYRSELPGGPYQKIGQTINTRYIDAGVVEDIVYYYVLDAEDFAGNKSNYSEEVDGLITGIDLIEYIDFEENDGGFISGTKEGNKNPWEHGTPTSGPKKAASGEKLWATNLNGSYEKNTSAFIQGLGVEIPEDKTPVLTFNHWYDFGHDRLDFGNVMVSEDFGMTWDNVTPSKRFGQYPKEWNYEEIILEGYEGKTVTLRFTLQAKNDDPGEGWYIDDIGIHGIDYVPKPIPEKEVITYDDGSAEEGATMFEPGEGCAMRFRPQTRADLKGAYVYLWGEDWPEPGGDRLGFAVYGINPIMMPVKIGKTIFVDKLTRGDWNYIDLSELDFTADGDFYISTIQDDYFSFVPGLGVDKDSTYDGRAYFNNNGIFEQALNTGFEGAFMIRADVDYINSDKEQLARDNRDILPNQSTKNVKFESKIQIMEERKKTEHNISQLKLNSAGVNNELKFVTDEELFNTNSELGGVPAEDGVVTILETGRSVKVDPITGRYSMRAPVGEFTLLVEAYGFLESMVDIEVLAEETIIVDYMLENKPTGTIQGKVVDRYYSNDAAFAKISLAEDSRVNPVIADENGHFVIEDVLVGEYTLKASANGFNPGEKQIIVKANEVLDVEIGLKRYVGFENEIGYDDGVFENALVVNDISNGVAVRFTPEEYGKVTGANVYFWDDSWPTPGGDRIGFLIYGINQEGRPYKVGEPIYQNVERGKWNRIDLSEFGFLTDKDFLISTIQVAQGPASPAVGIDYSAPEDRSYANLGGEFQYIKSGGIEGGLGIRAIFETAIDTPIITNLKDVNYINQDKLTIEGRVRTDSKVNIFVNGKIEKTINSTNLTFATEIDLTEEENRINVTSEYAGRPTEPSPDIKVIKDLLAPMLSLQNPKEDGDLNVELVEIKGKVQDNIGLNKLLINGEEIDFDKEGNFEKKMFLDLGLNTIIFQAYDLAGNLTEIKRNIRVKLDGSGITEMIPENNRIYEQGETIELSFMSDPGGQASFEIIMGDNMLSNVHTGIEMRESEEVPGLYRTKWEIPEGFAIKEAMVEFEFIDSFGNRTVAIGPGRITILGISMDKLPNNSIIFGEEAYDAKLLDTDSYVQKRLKNWDGPIYIKLNANTIVNAEGEIVNHRIVLPQMLTYFGINGQTKVYEKID